jgi:hypothetical protein
MEGPRRSPTRSSSSIDLGRDDEARRHRPRIHQFARRCGHRGRRITRCRSRSEGAGVVRQVQWRYLCSPVSRGVGRLRRSRDDAHMCERGVGAGSLRAPACSEQIDIFRRGPGRRVSGSGECASGLQRVNLDTGVPVVFGVLTTETIEQALERSVPGPTNKGYEAAITALEMLDVLARLVAPASVGSTTR